MYQRERCGVVIADHCNLSCTACNHLSPLLKKKLMDPAAFERTVHLLAKHIHFKCLTFQGGEPLLHPEVNKFLQIGRDSGIADEMHVLTNATRLHQMDNVFWDRVDRVRISSYPGVKIEPIPSARSRKVEITRLGTFTEAFSTVRNEDPVLVKKIKEACELFDRCFSIAGDYLHKCIVACFIPYGVPHEVLRPVTIDGVYVDEREALAQDIDAYLDDKGPLRACEFCAGSSGRRFTQTQTPRDQWLTRHHKPIAEQLDPVFLASLRA